VGNRRGLILAVASLILGLAVVLALTRPNVEMAATGQLRRLGGVCLELERWGLFGWSAIGQTRTVQELQNSRWQTPVEAPPCASVPEREYLVRVFTQPPGVYRLCGLADDRDCVEFRRVEP
jgi:hypothetical protein